MEGEEFRIIDPAEGASADAILHAAILDTPRAEFAADEAAIRAAVSLGVPADQARIAVEM